MQGLTHLADAAICRRVLLKGSDATVLRGVVGAPQREGAGNGGVRVFISGTRPHLDPKGEDLSGVR